MRTRAPRAAAIYARISHDPSGERFGVQRQEADCLEEATRRGWAVASVYVDDDRSAYSGKRRPEYERLLRDISGGLRDGVMIWRLDRLHRRPQELEEFILLCDKHDVALATVTGDVDLSTSQGRLLARAWGAFAAHESEVRAERLSRAAKDRATRGIMYTPCRLYGYNPDGLTIRRREAHVIREAARRVLTGESLRSITSDFTRRKIPTMKGGPWQPQVLRGMLINPRVAGYSTYYGEIVGKGNWKAILPRQQSERLRFFLMDPSRRARRGPMERNAFRSVLRCGRCGGPMTVKPVGHKRYYSCNQEGIKRNCGRVSVPADKLVAYVMARAWQRLNRPELPALLDAASMPNRQWLRAKETAELAERRLERLASDYGRGALTRSEWQAARRGLVEQRDRSRSLLRSEGFRAVIGEFVGEAERLREAWPTLPVSRQRCILEALLEEVRVWPAPSTRPGPVDDRITVWWRGDPRPRLPWRRLRRGIAERRQAGEFARCSVVGCTNPYLSNGFCGRHGQRWRKHGEPGPAGYIRRPPYRGALCSEELCSEQATSRGLCRVHYRVWQKETAAIPVGATAPEGRDS